MVTLTNSAVAYLKRVCPPENYITLGVKGGGCSGMAYVWDFKSNWPDVKWYDPIDDVLVLFVNVFIILLYERFNNQLARG